MAEDSTAPTKYALIGPSEDGTVEDLLDQKSERESHLRLQALIAEWLRMENVVVLAGAGTSINAGGKTMAVLETAVLETLGALSDVPKNVHAIVEHRRASAPTSSLGFEDWLSFLANGAHLLSTPESPITILEWAEDSVPSAKELAWLVEVVGRCIFAECALVLPEVSGLSTDASPHLAFLAKLVARDSNLGRANLFTLNYDTLFEQGLELLGIQYFDGFSGRANARFDPSVYGLDIYYPGEVAEGRVRRLDKFLHLYKPHGSIHWSFEGGILQARHLDLSTVAQYRELAPGEKAAWIEQRWGPSRVAGILPTANKFAQTLTMPYAHLFRSFQLRLATPQTFLLILGYGFADEHVNRVIDTALMNPSLVMLVVEPNPNSPTIARIRRYKALGKRAFVLTQTRNAFEAEGFTRATFADFAISVMPNVQWLNDFVRLRRFEKQIATGGDA
jgi:hypothetical protein